jgi:SAM-dependent methyltransferase
MTSSDDRRYEDFYRDRDPLHVYPVEFVVRAFLGSYPRLARDHGRRAGQAVLDLGFGDGRNMPLLANLGLRIAGVEIAKDICARTADRMERLGIETDLRVGRNRSIPFDDGSFDAVLACHACYYVDEGSSFSENLAEIARVTRPGGRFVFSAPIGSSYIMRGAEPLGDGHMRIANDPYGVRQGIIMRKFDRPEEIEAALRPWFEGAAIGSCRNDFWGIEEHVWIVSCQRSAGGRP